MIASKRALRRVAFGILIVCVVTVGFVSPPASQAQAKVATPTFKKLNPPLMKAFGPNWVLENALFKGPTTTKKGSYDPPKAAGSKVFAGKHFVPMTITSYYQWRRLEGPLFYPVRTTVTDEISITDATSTTTTLQKRLEATVEVGADVGFAQFSASITAEVTSSLEFQRSFSTTKTNTVTVEIEANTYTASWVLEQVVHLKSDKYDLGALISGPWGSILGPDGTPYLSQLDETYVVPINTYRDSWVREPITKKKTKAK